MIILSENANVLDDKFIEEGLNKAIGALLGIDITALRCSVVQNSYQKTSSVLYQSNDISEHCGVIAPACDCVFALCTNNDVTADRFTGCVEVRGKSSLSSRSFEMPVGYVSYREGSWYYCRDGSGRTEVRVG